MNLYTADLLANERIQERERAFEANRLAALARAPRTPAEGWRERAGRAVAWIPAIRREPAAR